jgi:hypothetical protein
MHLESIIERVGRCTWRPESGEFGDALGGRDQVELRDTLRGPDQDSLEMHLEAAMVQLRDAFRGRDGASLVMHSQAVIN